MDGNPMCIEQLCHKLTYYADSDKSNEIDRFPFLVNILQDLSSKLAYEITSKELIQSMDDFLTCIQDEALQCSNKPGRAMHLAKTIIDVLFIFKSILKNRINEIINHEYLNRVSKILTTYVDMELKASVKARIDHASIANQISANIDSHLQASDESQILNVFINMSRLISIHKDILLKLFQKYLYRPIVLQPRELDDDLFIKYVILYKTWKNIETNANEKRRITDLCVSFVKPKKTLWNNKRLKLLLGKDIKAHQPKQLVFFMCTKISISELKKYTRIQDPCSIQETDSDIEVVYEELEKTYLPATSSTEQLIDVSNIKLEHPTIIESIDLTDDVVPKPLLDETRIEINYQWLNILCDKSKMIQSVKFLISDTSTQNRNISDIIEIVDEEVANQSSQLSEEDACPSRATSANSGRIVRTYERTRQNSGVPETWKSSYLKSSSVDRTKDFESDDSSLAQTNPEYHKKITEEIINDWEATSTVDEDENNDAHSVTAPRTAITVSLPLQFINSRSILEKSPRKAWRFNSNRKLSKSVGVSFAKSNMTDVPHKKSSMKSYNAKQSTECNFTFSTNYINTIKNSSSSQPPLLPTVRFSEQHTQSTVNSDSELIGLTTACPNLERRKITYSQSSSYHQYQQQHRKLPVYTDVLKKPTILEKKTYINVPRIVYYNSADVPNSADHKKVHDRSPSAIESRHKELSANKSQLGDQNKSSSLNAVARFSSKYNQFIEDSDSEENDINTPVTIFNNKCQAYVDPKAIDTKTFKASVQLMDILKVIDQTKNVSDLSITQQFKNSGNKSFRRSERNRARAYVKFEDNYLDNRLFEPTFNGNLVCGKKKPGHRRGRKRNRSFEEFGKSLTDLESENDGGLVGGKSNLTDFESDFEANTGMMKVLNEKCKQNTPKKSNVISSIFRPVSKRKSSLQRRKSRGKKRNMMLKSEFSKKIEIVLSVEPNIESEYPRAFSNRKKINSFAEAVVNESTLLLKSPSVMEVQTGKDVVSEVENVDRVMLAKSVKVYKRASNRSKPAESQQLHQVLDPNVTMKIVLTKCDETNSGELSTKEHFLANRTKSEHFKKKMSSATFHKLFRSAENLDETLKCQQINVLDKQRRQTITNDSTLLNQLVHEKSHLKPVRFEQLENKEIEEGEIELTEVQDDLKNVIFTRRFTKSNGNDKQVNQNTIPTSEITSDIAKETNNELIDLPNDAWDDLVNKPLSRSLKKSANSILEETDPVRNQSVSSSKSLVNEEQLEIAAESHTLMLTALLNAAQNVSVTAETEQVDDISAKHKLQVVKNSRWKNKSHTQGKNTNKNELNERYVVTQIETNNVTLSEPDTISPAKMSMDLDHSDYPINMSISEQVKTSLRNRKSSHSTSASVKHTNSRKILQINKFVKTNTEFKIQEEATTSTAESMEDETPIIKLISKRTRKSSLDTLLIDSTENVDAFTKSTKRNRHTKMSTIDQPAKNECKESASNSVLEVVPEKRNSRKTKLIPKEDPTATTLDVLVGDIKPEVSGIKSISTKATKLEQIKLQKPKFFLEREMKALDLPRPKLPSINKIMDKTNSKKQSTTMETLGKRKSEIKEISTKLKKLGRKRKPTKFLTSDTIKGSCKPAIDQLSSQDSVSIGDTMNRDEKQVSIGTLNSQEVEKSAQKEKPMNFHQNLTINSPLVDNTLLVPSITETANINAIVPEVAKSSNRKMKKFAHEEEKKAIDNDTSVTAKEDDLVEKEGVEDETIRTDEEIVDEPTTTAEPLLSSYKGHEPIKLGNTRKILQVHKFRKLPKPQSSVVEKTERYLTNEQLTETFVFMHENSFQSIQTSPSVSSPSLIASPVDTKSEEFLGREDLPEESISKTSTSDFLCITENAHNDEAKPSSGDFLETANISFEKTISETVKQSSEEMEPENTCCDENKDEISENSNSSTSILSKKMKRNQRKRKMFMPIRRRKVSKQLESNIELSVENKNTAASEPQVAENFQNEGSTLFENDMKTENESVVQSNSPPIMENALDDTQSHNPLPTENEHLVHSCETSESSLDFSEISGQVSEPNSCDDAEPEIQNNKINVDDKKGVEDNLSAPENTKAEELNENLNAKPIEIETEFECKSEPDEIVETPIDSDNLAKSESSIKFQGNSTVEGSIPSFDTEAQSVKSPLEIVETIESESCLLLDDNRSLDIKEEISPPTSGSCQKYSEDADDSESETSISANVNDTASENSVTMENYQIAEEISLDSDEIFIESRAHYSTHSEHDTERHGEFSVKKGKKNSNNFLGKRRYPNNVTHSDNQEKNGQQPSSKLSVLVWQRMEEKPGGKQLLEFYGTKKLDIEESKLKSSITVSYEKRRKSRVHENYEPKTDVDEERNENIYLDEIDSTTTKEEPASLENSPPPSDVQDESRFDEHPEHQEKEKPTTESPLPHTSVHNINTNFDTMFMDCLSSNQKDIINDSTLGFDMSAGSAKRECEDDEDDDEASSDRLNEVLNAHPSCGDVRSEEEEEIRANKYFETIPNNLNNAALIDSTISLCNEYEDPKEIEEGSALYMGGVDLIASTPSTTETDEEEALNNDSHVENTMNQIYDILKEDAANVEGQNSENVSSIQITSTCRSILLEETSTDEKIDKKHHHDNHQPDFDNEIPKNAIFDQQLLQKLIEKSSLITPGNSGSSSSSSQMQHCTYNNDVSSTIKSPKDDHVDESFVCKADSTNLMAKNKRTYSRKRVNKRPPKIEILTHSGDDKIMISKSNCVETICLPSSSSVSPKTEIQYQQHQQIYDNISNANAVARLEYGSSKFKQTTIHQAPMNVSINSTPQHGGTAIVLSPVTHNKTSVKLVQYITNPSNVVGNAKSFCTISNNLIGKQPFMMQPTGGGTQSYTITTNKKMYAANNHYEHDSNSSTSSSSSMGLDQQHQQQQSRIASSGNVIIAPSQPTKMKTVVAKPGQYFIINKNKSSSIASSGVKPVIHSSIVTTSYAQMTGSMQSPPIMMNPNANNRKPIIQSVQVVNAPRATHQSQQMLNNTLMNTMISKGIIYNSDSIATSVPHNFVNVKMPLQEGSLPKKRGRPKGSKNKPVVVATDPYSDARRFPAILTKKKRVKVNHNNIQEHQQLQNCNISKSFKRKVNEMVIYGGVVETEEMSMNICNLMDSMHSGSEELADSSHHHSPPSSTTTAQNQSLHFNDSQISHQLLKNSSSHHLLSSAAPAASNEESQQLSPEMLPPPPMQQNVIIDYTTTHLCDGGDTFIDSLNDIESASTHSYHDDDFVMTSR